MKSIIITLICCLTLYLCVREYCRTIVGVEAVKLGYIKTKAKTP